MFQIDLSRLPIEFSGCSLFEIGTELRPYVFCLSRNYRVCRAKVFFRAKRSVGSSGDHIASFSSKAIQNFFLALKLNGHPTNANDICLMIPIDRFDVLIHDG